MDASVLNAHYDYIIRLVRSAIDGSEPGAAPDGCDYELVFRLAQMHAVDNIIYVPLAAAEVPAEQLKSFEDAYNQAIMVDATQQYYLDEIINVFEEKGIVNCVMKGPIIKKLYPSTDLRRSGDLDIYVPDEQTSEVRDIMVGLGFDIKRFNKAAAHDEYITDKFIEVEIHRQLISNKCPWDEKCQEITERLILTDGSQYSYEMSPEDYYLYMIGHMAKHMKYSGMGIKMVLDVWVYLRKMSDKLDFTVLDERLRYTGLYEFERNVRALCDHWFERKPAELKIKQMANYILSSGNFGTHEQLVSTEMAENSAGTSNRAMSKIVYYAKTVFWPYQQMCNKYPILEKLPFLLPFFWIYRPVYAMLFKKDSAAVVRSRYNNTDLDEAQQILAFKQSLGL